LFSLAGSLLAEISLPKLAIAWIRREGLRHVAEELLPRVNWTRPASRGRFGRDRDSEGGARAAECTQAATAPLDKS
jgi:hypothetical protein